MGRHATRVLLVFMLVAPPAFAETIWLRGRGKDVWIEKDGEIQAPKKNRKGFTRVETPRVRAVYRDPARQAPNDPSRTSTVVIGAAREPYRVYHDDYPYWRRHRQYGRHHRYANRHDYGRHRDGLSRASRHARHRGQGVRSGGKVRGHAKVGHGRRSSGGSRGGHAQRGGGGGGGRRR